LHIAGLRRRDRRSLLATTALQGAVLIVLAAPAAAQPAPKAAPVGGQVVAGSASIAQTPSTTTITQSTSRAAVNWKSFDVGSQETVTFNQPNASSVTLNRVTGPDPSQIAGHITANGQVVLTNQSGVVFTQGAQVDVATLVVSAAGITNQNFMAGKMVFDIPANPNARIVNAGTISVAQTGLAALVAPQVSNTGLITARLGHVVLAGASTETVDLYGDGLLSLNVSNQVATAPVGPDGTPVKVLVTNSGVIRADGGTVQLTAAAVDGLVQNLVTAGGKISANSVGSHTGTVVATGIGGSVVVTGSISAAGHQAGTSGGNIALNASDSVSLAPTARVTASGRAGGGTIAVGTTLARAQGGSSVTPTMTAKNTSIAAGASVAADATGQGNGGRVTVLSTQSTAMAGKITARGGPHGGNGGTVEISGLQGYSVTGQVDVSAAQGAAGTILLDPFDLTVADSSAQGEATAATPTGSPANTVAYNDTNSSEFVSIQTINGFSGNIVLQAQNNLNVQYTSAGMNTINPTATSLTMQAGNNLNIDSGIAINLGTGNVVLAGGWDFVHSVTTGTGGLFFNTSNGTDATGPVTITASSVTLQAGSGGINLSSNTLLGTSGSPLTTLDMSTLGSISQPADTSGGMNVSTLQSTSGVTGNVALSGSNNVVASLGSFSTNGNFALVDTSGLTVAGPVVAGTVSAPNASNTQSITLTTGGTLALTGTLNAGSVGLIALGAITEPTGVIFANTLTGPTATTPATSASLGGANSISNLGTFATSGSLSLSDTLALTVNAAVSGSSVALSSQGALVETSAGSITATAASGAVNLTAGGSIALGGTVSATGASASVSLIANGGSITETVSSSDTGIVNTTSLGGSATSTVTLDNSSGGGNSIANLGSFSSSGNFTLVDAIGLSVAGPVTAGTVLAPNASNTQSMTLTGLGTLALNGTLNAGSVGLIASGAITEPTGVIFANTLTGPTTATPATSASLGGANSISNLGSFATSGSLSLSDNLALTVNGAVSGSSVALSSQGALVETSAGSITATAASGAVNLTAGGSIALGGTVSATGASASVSLIANGGSITETVANSDTGIVNTTSLGGSATSTVTLDNSSGGGNSIANLGSFSSTGNFTLVDAIGLNVAGPVSALAQTITLTTPGTLALNGTLNAGSVGLIASGAITEPSGVIIAGTLTGPTGATTYTTAASASLGGTNSISNLGTFITSGNFALTDSIGLTVTGPVTAGTVSAPNASNTQSITLTGSGTLTLNGTLNAGSVGLIVSGAITEPTGVIFANTLTGPTAITPAASASLGGANSISNLGSFATSGNLSLSDNLALTVNGAVSGSSVALTSQAALVETSAGSITATAAAGTVNLTAGGSIALGGTVSATGTAASVSLIANGGSITETVASLDTGIINATSLAGSAAGPVTLDDSSGGGNAIANLGSFSSTGNFTLVDQYSLGLGVAGPVSATGTLNISNTGNLAFSGNATAPTLTLSATGAITQTGGTLSGSGAGASVSLSAGSSIAFGGTISAANVTLTTTGGGITETVGGNDTGVIDATFLTGSATGGTVSATRVLLDNPGTIGSANQVATLGAFSTPSDFILFDGGSALSVVGVVSAGDGVTARNATLSLTAPSLTLQSTGSLSATTVVSSGTAFPALVALRSDTISLAGSITALDGDVSIDRLTSGAILIGGAPSAGTLAIQQTDLTHIQTVGTLGGLGTDVVAVGTLSFTTPAAEVTALDISSSVNLSSISTTLALFSAGNITEAPAAGITATHVTALAGGSISLVGTINAIGTLGTNLVGSVQQTALGAGYGDITAGGAIDILDANSVGVTLARNLTATGAASVTTSAGNLTVAAGTGTYAIQGSVLSLSAPAGNIIQSGAFSTIRSTSGTLALSAGQTITQSAGLISAATDADLTATGDIVQSGAISAGNNANLAAANIYQTSSGAISSGNISLTAGSGGSLALGGTISATGGVTLIAPGGTIGQAYGTLDTGTIDTALLQGTTIGTAPVAVTLDRGSVNSITNLGSFTASGTFVLSSATSFTLSGTDSAATIALTSVNGAITQNGGSSVTATGTGSPSLSLSASTGIGQASGATLAATNPAGSITLQTNGGTIALGGTVSAGTTAGSLALLTTSGPVTETYQNLLTGSITANTLTGTVGGAVSLGNVTGNTIANLGSFTAAGAGGLQLQDAVDLTVTGSVSAPSVTLTSQNAITQTAATTITASDPNGSVTLTAGSSISLGGTISATGTGSSLGLVAQGGGIDASTGIIDATTLIGSSAGTVALTNSFNTVANLGAFTTTAGGFSLLDASGLAIIGTGSAPAISLTTTTGSITQAAGTTLSSTGAIALTAAGSIALGGSLSGVGIALVAQGGGITETNPSDTGIITASTLTGSATTGVTLDDASGTSNQIAILGSFTTGGGFALVDGTSLTVAGPLSVAGTESISTIQGASLTLNATQSAPQLLFTASGSISQIGGTLTATGSASPSLSLTASGGPILQSSGAGLTASAATGTVVLTASGSIALGGSLSGVGIALVAQGGGITETNGGDTGTIAATTLTGAATTSVILDNTSGAANQIANLGSFTTSGAFTLLDAAPLTIAGPLTTGVQTITAPSLVITGGDIATTMALTASTGAITQLSGTITATADGSPSTPSVLLTADGSGIFQASGAVFAASSQAGSISLVAGTAGTMALGGTLSATGLNAGITFTAPGGAISQTYDGQDTGVIIAALVQGTGSTTAAMPSSVALDNGSANQITTLGSFPVNGPFVLSNATSFAVAGADSGTSVVFTSVSGAITQNAGSAITASSASVTLIGSTGITQASGATTAAATNITLQTASGSLSLGGSTSAASLTLLDGNGSVSETGSVDVTTLTGNVLGAVSLGTSTNQITNLGSFTATGLLALQDSIPLTVTGPVSALSIALTSLGSITQDTGTTLTETDPNGTVSLTAGTSISLGGTIFANGTGASLGLIAQGGSISGVAGILDVTTLNGASTGPVTLTDSGNQIANLGSFTTTTGSFSLLDSNALAITGSNTAPAISLTTSAGSITQAAGTTLSSAGAITLISAGSIALGGLISASGTAASVALIAQGGGITETNPADTGIIAATLLTGSATSGVTLDNSTGSGNQISALGSFTTDGAFTLVDGATLTLSGPLSVAGVETISTTQGRNITLAGNDSAPQIALTSAGAISQTGGTVTATGTIALNAVGSIALGGALSAVGVSLVAQGGGITETNPTDSGTIAATTLTGSATGAVTLDDSSGAGNQIANLGSFTAGGPFTLQDASALAISGPLATGAQSITAPSLTITATDTAPTIALTASTGAITQSSGTITATGSANPSVTLTANGSGITQDSGALITATNAAGTVSLVANNAGSLALGGTISATGATGSVTLTDHGGSIGQTVAGMDSGVITTTLLQGPTTGTTPTSVTLDNGSGNQIANLGSFTTNGPFTLKDSTALTVTGADTATSITLVDSLGITQASGSTLVASAATGSVTLQSTTGTIAIGGTIAATGSGGSVVLLVGTGPVTETGSVDATTLTGTVGGAVTLGSTNAITNLGSFTATGVFSLQDVSSLSVNGSVTAPSVSLTSQGAIAQNAVTTITASDPNGTVSLTAGTSISLGGTISAAGTGASVGLIAQGGGISETTGFLDVTTLNGTSAGTVALNNGGNLVANLGSFTTTTGSFSLLDGSPLAITGANSAPAISLTTSAGSITQAAGTVLSSPGAVVLTSAGSIALGGTISATGTAASVALIAQGGGISETNPTDTGIIAATVLTGSATGAVVLDNIAGTGNQIANLGSFTAGGAFTLVDGTNLSVSGPLSVAGVESISTTQAKDLTVSATDSAPQLLLTSTDAINQTGGTLTATGSSGTIVLTAAGSIALAGTLAATGSAASVNLFAQGGGITEPTGIIDATTLNGAASAGVTLNNTSGTGNQIANLGSFTTGAAFVMQDAVPLTITGPNSAASLTLTSTGAITGATGGTLTAAGAAGSVVLDAISGTIGLAGTISAPGSSASVTLIAANGGVSETGSIDATTLNGAVSGTTATPNGTLSNAATLNSTTNQIANLGSFTTSGAFQLTDATSLTVTGPNIAATIFLESSSGSITQATGSSLTATAAGTPSIELLATSGSITQESGASLSAKNANGIALLSASIGTITIGGTVSAPQVAIEADLNGGSVTETYLGTDSGSLVATTLSGFGGAVTLDNTAGNQVANLGVFTATGALVLKDAEALTISGNVSAPSVALTSLSSIAQNSGTTIAASTASGTVSVTAGTTTAMVTIPVSTATGTISLTAGSSIALGGTLAATGSTASVVLVAQGGGITETNPADTGFIQAAQLSGSATSDVVLDNPNQVGTLAGFNGGGGFTLVNGQNLTVTGPLTIAGVETIRTTAGSLTFNAADTAAQIALTAAGGFSQTGGSITATDAAATPSLAVTTQGGPIQQSSGASLAATDTAGSIVLTSASSIALGGLVSAPGSAATVTLTAQNGGITETNPADTGSIQATTLTGTAPGSVTLDNSGNQVGTLAGFSAGGSFTLTDAQNLTETGALTAAGVSVSETGALTVNGSVTAPTIALSASATTLAGALTAPLITVNSPQSLTLASGTITTGYTPRSGATVLANYPQAPDAGTYLSTDAFTQTGTTALYSAQAGTADSTLVINIAPSGTIHFDDLAATNTQLFMALGGGAATGPIYVRDLYISYTGTSGGTQLLGEVGGVGGDAAAAKAYITSGVIATARSSQYRVNNCAVGSVNCVVVTPEAIPVTNPIQEILIGNTQDQNDDPDLILPNVAERDY
jgi:filamentous hemagglutinin family protein